MMFFFFIFIENIIKAENVEGLKIVSVVFIILQVVHILIYVFLSRRLIQQAQKSADQQKPSLSRIHFKWSKYFMAIIYFIGALVLTMHFLVISGGYYQINNSADFLFLVMLSLIVLNIIYKSLKQPEIISGIYHESEKYKNSKLSKEKSNNLKLALEELLMNEQIFLTPELNLSELATRMDTKTHLVSQLINEQYQKTFFGLMNNFRVDFAKKMIENRKMLSTTLEGIAYESGFNS